MIDLQLLVIINNVYDLETLNVHTSFGNMSIGQMC